MEIPKRTYRHIFIVQNRNSWRTCPYDYEPSTDVIFTFDFGLYREIKLRGGDVFYIDHIVNSEKMEEHNYETYRFFAQWYLDCDRKDIFKFKGIGFGRAFWIEIWNDVTYWIRIYLSLTAIKNLEYEKVFAAIDDVNTLDIMHLINIKADTWDVHHNDELCDYYFPVFQWMKERIYPSGLKATLKTIATRIFRMIIVFGEKIKIVSKPPIDIYVDIYHPTQPILEKLLRDKRVSAILGEHNKSSLFSTAKCIPLNRFFSKGNEYNDKAKAIIEDFHSRKCNDLFIENNNVSQYLYDIIIKRVSASLPQYLNDLDSIIRFFHKRTLKLMVNIGSIGIPNALMISFCKKINVPVYTIINGLLLYSFLDEAKDGTWINSYGESIKCNYFKGMKNIKCLGDPRMDHYAVKGKKKINREAPVVMIGAAGFDNIDLNSYLAYEFDFLSDVLTALKAVMTSNRTIKIVVKVRSNGYIEHYSNFLSEYYPDLHVTLYDKKPIAELFDSTDLYISIFSGTLFEASCLGIPVIYYKKDTQNLHSPFDGKSELVTAQSVMELVQKIEKFFDGDEEIYEAFKKKEVMERYVGPLDGYSLQRNMDFIYSLISEEPGVTKQSS
jgi:hypothetical protein